jgi:hypothetical protein
MFLQTDPVNFHPLPTGTPPINARPRCKTLFLLPGGIPG